MELAIDMKFACNLSVTFDRCSIVPLSGTVTVTADGLKRGYVFFNNTSIFESDSFSSTLKVQLYGRTLYAKCATGIRWRQHREKKNSESREFTELSPNRRPRWSGGHPNRPACFLKEEGVQRNGVVTRTAYKRIPLGIGGNDSRDLRERVEPYGDENFYLTQFFTFHGNAKMGNFER
ncbi:hypothetical protein J6590_085516 [Homalodisca vitripennis]|nr:hypothetical protein J6590_085516 [Homalodisca vitripennis]